MQDLLVHLTRPQAFALMVLGYVAGLTVLLLDGSVETTLGFALASGLALAAYAYAYAWFGRGRP